MEKNLEILLERHGWVLECLSPLEMRHEETGSFATQLAANIVCEYLRELDKEEGICNGDCIESGQCSCSHRHDKM